MKVLLSFLLLGLWSAPLLAQQFSDYIEKQIQSGVLTRPEALKLYPGQIITTTARPPVKSTKIRYLAIVKEYITRKKTDWKDFGTGTDYVLLRSAESVCQSARMGRSPRQSSVPFKAGLKMQIAQIGFVDPNFANIFTEGILQGLEKTNYCAEIPNPSTPQSVAETRYLALVRNTLEQRELGMFINGQDRAQVDGALLKTGRDLCWASKEGVSLKNLRASSFVGGISEVSPGAINRQVGEAIVDAILQATRSELCPSP